MARGCTWPIGEAVGTVAARGMVRGVARGMVRGVARGMVRGMVRGTEEVELAGGLLARAAASGAAANDSQRRPKPNRQRQVYPAKRCGDANEDHDTKSPGHGEVQPLDGLPARKADPRSQPAPRQYWGRMFPPGRGSPRNCR
jgi:hypothetical protein